MSDTGDRTFNIFGTYIEKQENNFYGGTNYVNGAEPKEVIGDDDREKAAVLMSNEEFGLIMRKAVEQGFCIQSGWQYKWKVKVEAAYFASLASHRFNLSDRKDHDGDVTISWIPFEALFGEKNLRLAYNDYNQCKTTIRRKSEIDYLFR